MFKDKDSINIPSRERDSVLPSSSAERLTALWALSESTLGGILHAIKIPFRGMIISGVAVILITLIANFSSKKKQILQSTIAVITAKAIISPHSPITAYGSVFLQGLFGTILFASKKFRLFSAIVLGLTVALINGAQKIIVLTLIYGSTLWETINDFVQYISEEWFFLSFDEPLNFSLLLIALYIGIHLVAGLSAGIIAHRTVTATERRLVDKDSQTPLPIHQMRKRESQGKKGKKLLKPSALAIFLLAVTILTISYFYPEGSRFDVNAIMIMIARSVIIIYIWFYFLSPKIKKLIRRFLTNRKSTYSKDVESILASLPMVKAIIYSAWKESERLKGIMRLKYFITSLIFYLISYPGNQEEGKT